MPNERVLLWDVMETLVSEPFYDVMPTYFGMTVDQLRREMHPTSWIEFEEGKLTEQQYYERFFRDGRTVDGQALRQVVRSGYHWLEGMEQLLAQLKQAGYPMYAMSNYSVWYEIIEEKLRLSRYLEWTFVSCHTGLRKPDHRAYRYATDTLGVPSESCIFIDDRPVNVEAARAVGMVGIVRTTAESVRRELEELGIL